MLIDILLTSLSIFTSSQRTTVSPSRLHRRIRLVHAKRPPRQRLSPRRPTGSYPETGFESPKPTYGSPRFWHIYSRFFSAASLLECTMSKLMGRTGGTGIQSRAMDMV
jgi:hypothetical protein